LVHGASWLYGLAFGFGLSPARALATVVLCILAGGVMFNAFNAMGAMTSAAREPAGAPPRQCGDEIEAVVYAADVFLPLIDLREEQRCEIAAAPRQPVSPSMITAFRLLKAAYAILGWIVTTTSVLTFTGVLRHSLAQD
jgi:hypothetical protein